MNFIRNPEIQRSLIGYGILAVGASVCAWILGGGRMAGLMLVVCVLFIVLHFSVTYQRYQEIAKLGLLLDQILHDTQTDLLQDSREGELAILNSQIIKLVLRLREQADTLQKDKVFLADSLADISHQIKTPLTSIHILLSFLKEDEILETRRKEITRDIGNLLERIDWQIYALLKLSRLDAGMASLKKEKILLEELFRRSYELVAVPMDIRDISWNCQTEDQAYFLGDFSWSVEAVTNILKNCIEHTPPGGAIQVNGIQNAIYTEIKIIDSGNGIAKEDLPRLFERFYRGKEEESQSAGIGLSLSQKIITEQNGTILAGNAVGGGAEFIVRFYKTIV